jgi:hypothetical protein
MNLINSWSSKIKQSDKFSFLVRVANITIFDLSFDLSAKRFRLIVLNFGLGNNVK